MRPHHWFVGSAVLALTLACGGAVPGQTVQTVDKTECSSGKKWVGGDHESELMHPGGDCIGCHTDNGEGPKFTVAGTVYASAHEADDCFGVAGAQVEITDNNGTVTTLTTNEAGNFHTDVAMTFPYKVRVLANGGENRMSASQNTGRCASCHTAEGTGGAPGRVQIP